MNLKEASKYAAKILDAQWVKWIHKGSRPAETAAEREMNVATAMSDPKHCASCLNMNGSCFIKEKSPICPRHEHCHCFYEDIGTIDAKAESVIEKYTKYVFAPGNDKGKNDLFKAWGYDIRDAYYLKEEIERQGRLAYRCGEYELGKTNEYGQRLNIVIHLLRRDTGKEVTFVSGWLVYPNGRIALTTPYGDRI